MHPPDSQPRRQQLLSLPPHPGAGGWKERVKAGAAEQPSANMYVAAEASVPNQIIIKPHKNNANTQHRLVLKKCCLFLLIPPARPVTIGKSSTVRGTLTRATEGKKPQGQPCFCGQQESPMAGVTALSIYPRDICNVYSSTTYTSTSKTKKYAQKICKRQVLKPDNMGCQLWSCTQACATREQFLRHQSYGYSTGSPGEIFHPLSSFERHHRGHNSFVEPTKPHNFLMMLSKRYINSLSHPVVLQMTPAQHH